MSCTIIRTTYCWICISVAVKIDEIDDVYLYICTMEIQVLSTRRGRFVMRAYSDYNRGNGITRC